MRIMRTNLSDKVTEWLVSAFQEERYKPGDQLPSVEQLALDLQVGRGSVREAMRSLLARGMVSIVHGKGTFVNQPRFLFGSYLVSFTEYIRRLGMEPSSAILSRDMINPDESLCSILNVLPDEKINYLYRLRLADGSPMAIEKSYTPYQRFPDLLVCEWTATTSLYQILTEKYGVTFGYSKQTITSVPVDEDQSQLLQVPVKTPGLSVEEIVYLADGTPIELTNIVYRGDRYQYSLTLPGKPSASAS